MVDAALSIKFELIPSSSLPEPRTVRLVEIILTGIPTAIVLVGIALVGYQHDWAEDKMRADTPDMVEENGAERFPDSKKNGPSVFTEEL